MRTQHEVYLKHPLSQLDYYNVTRMSCASAATCAVYSRVHQRDEIVTDNQTTTCAQSLLAGIHFHWLWWLLFIYTHAKDKAHAEDNRSGGARMPPILATERSAPTSLEKFNVEKQ